MWLLVTVVLVCWSVDLFVVVCVWLGVCVYVHGCVCVCVVCKGVFVLIV